MIENGIARLDIAQEIDQRNLVGLRTRKRAHNKIEIRRGKPRPTIRPDHRDFIMCDGCADGKQIANGRAICQDCFRTLLALSRIDRGRIACRSRTLPLRTFSRDILDFPGDRNRLKRVRRGKLFQKLLNLRGFAVFDNHINLSLARLKWQLADPLKSSPPVSRPSMSEFYHRSSQQQAT